MLFRAYRFDDDPFTTLRYRDLEFHWDALTDSVLSGDVRTTLDNYAENLVVTRGVNPLGYDMSLIELVYDYFHNSAFPSNYTRNSRDTTAVVFGDSTWGWCQDITPYKPTDRCHVDFYLADSIRSLAYLTGATALGIYPSRFQSIDEDLSDGRSVHEDIRHANSIAVRLPRSSDRHDLDGTGWTSPGSLRNTAFFHEFQHGLVGAMRGWQDEQMSALAEVVAGTVDTTSEIPYTWSLLGHQTTYRDLCDSLRGHGMNYVGRTSFAAYLLYNFRGADTSRTLTGMQDDLAFKWKRAAQGGPLWELRDLLRDSTCHDCSRLLDPPGQTLSNTARLAYLHHNWRVANYVNSPTLEQGRYGVPPQFALARSRNQRNWQALDKCERNDVVALPQEVTLGPADLTRDVLLHGTRSRNGVAVPMVLQPYGAEYWLIKSDPALAGSSQDLVIRVWSDSLGRRDGMVWRRTYGADTALILTFDGRLMASAVGYSEQTGSLWQHPEWATVAAPPKWTDTDSLGAVLEFVVPGFGTSVKAVLLPITMADAHQAFTETGLQPTFFPRDELIPYRLALALRQAPTETVNPKVVATNVSHTRANPTYSPAGDQVAYAKGTAPSRICLSPTNGAGTCTDMGGQLLGPGQQQPDWSPRGDRIVYQAWHRDPGMTLLLDAEPVLTPFAALHVFSLPTSEELQLTQGVDGEDSWPAFSPNGQQVAYVRRVAGSGGQADGPWQLRRVGSDGLGDTLLVQFDASVELAHPRWSPDGSLVYFLKDGSLAALSGQGTVTSRAGLAPSAANFDLSRSRGSLVMEEGAAATWRSEFWDTDSTTAIARLLQPFRRVSLRDTTLSLTTPCRYVTGAEYCAPRWSFDGTRVVYATNESHVGGGDIYVQQVSYNHAPVFTIAPRDTVLASVCGRSLSVTFAASDPDGETVTLEAAYLPPGATLTSQGQFSWPNPPLGSEYYSVIRALDASGGVAQKVVRLAVAADTLRPAAVSDLEVGNTGHYSMTVRWSDAGDDSLTGTACRIRLAYSIQQITETNFADCDTVAVPAPGPAGTPECAAISDLLECTRYYFRLKMQDDAGRWSALSSQTDGVTRCSGTAVAECDEGYLMAQAGSGGAWTLENAVLEQSGTTTATDISRLRRLRAQNGEARVRLSSARGRWALDAVSLAAIDHAPGQQALLHGSQILLGTLTAVERERDGKDSDLAATLAAGDTAVTATAASRWEVDLGDDGLPWLFLEAGGGDAHSTDADSGITIQRRDHLGQWLTIGSIAPRRGFTPLVVDSIRGGHVRLIFNREYLVRKLGRFAMTSVAKARQLTQQRAEHSRLGSVSAALGSVGGTEVALRPGEDVVLRFEAPDPDSGMVRDYFLVARGQRAASTQLTRAQEAESEAEARPLAFALHQSEPNPFTHATRIRFDLPRPSSVRLEIFDLQGRRIAVLADGLFPAGYHSSEWDGRTSGGGRIQAGVYAYRLQAGGFRAQRKLVLVP